MTTLHGVDVSSYQGAVHPSITAGGTDFVIVKATQGTTYVSPVAAQQRTRARNAGKLVGHYHFAAGGSPKDEAVHFLAHSDWKKGELLVLDWEMCSPRMRG